MIRNTFYSNNSGLALSTLLQDSQYKTSTLNSLIDLNSVGNINSLSRISISSTKTLSYADTLKLMKKQIEDKTDQKLSDNEEMQEKYEEAVKQAEEFDRINLLFDLMHTFNTSGIYSTKNKNKSSMWGNIFSLQAERVNAQSQIAIQTALRQQLNKLT